jgi:hypothetical protein
MDGRFVTRKTQEGIPRQFRVVRRRKKSEMTTTVASVGVSTDDKTNIDLACNIFVADLLNIDAWPEGTAKEQMVLEAMSQSNVNAHSKSRDATDLTIFIQNKVQSLTHLKIPNILIPLFRSNIVVRTGAPLSKQRHMMLFTSGVSGHLLKIGSTCPMTRLPSS